MNNPVAHKFKVQLGRQFTGELPSGTRVTWSVIHNGANQTLSLKTGTTIVNLTFDNPALLGQHFKQALERLFKHNDTHQGIT